MEVKLEDLMKAKQGLATADVTPDNLPSAEVMTAQVEKVVNDLTPEERSKVDKIKDELDLTDSTAILRFGAPAQQKIAEFSDSVLSQVRTKDSGPVGELLSSLVTQVREFEPEGNSSFLKKIPLVGSLVKKGEDIKQGYEKLSTQVERIQGNLEQAKLKMMKDVALFDKLYAENLSYFKQLQLYIQAGEEKLTEMREVTLPKLRQQAAESGDPMAVQVVADFEASVNRFEKKVHDLKISKTIAIQSAPQIRLIQNNDKALIDRVQTAIYSTIPLWKNQLVIALGLQAQQDVLRMQQAVSNTTNELLRRNAEMLQQNSIETAEENERSIVDIETVREVNERLINTIEETIKIQQNGRAKRQAAEAELVQIEGKLRDTLLKNSGRQETN
ncbi:MAG: toxic anion resistance protein [Selenomonas sp.]|uniref:toxic anion resistance protein n=1 Tax=Selenomonas sp. AE3005 TaxID=1485543 RepID=UPI000690EF4F|nr:toxic anion resistance protein [Selenomonas sp. AE3005]MBQ1613629.1 toxic anion resistance protein [Selenomonas sp.]MBQ1808071.1 toxic anion resistance protein [Selenomonas sp.]MBQ2137499.1 toxic anion resistance protein [Selenomonas sp.]